MTIQAEVASQTSVVVFAGVRLRIWIWVTAGLVLALATILTFIDPGDGEFGVGGSRYLLGKATIPVVLAASLVAPFALIEFFRWLVRTQGNPFVRYFGVGAVTAAFFGGIALSWDWRIAWLVEGDIEVDFGRDELFPVVVGLVAACLVALGLWLMLKDRSVVGA